MVHATLVFPRQWELIWLSRKKKKVGAGLYNGWGGKKTEKDRSILKAAIREFGEETGGFFPKPHELEKVAILDFYIEGVLIFKCHVFLFRPTEKMNGQLKETPEMGAGEFFARNNLPLDQMMVADREWLPRILKGERLRGKVFYTEGNKALEKPSVYRVVKNGKPL